MKPVIVTKPLGKYRPGDIFTPAKDAPVATWIRRAKVRPLTPEEQEAWEAKQARDKVQRTEDRGQRTEVKTLNPESGDQKSKIKNQK